MPSYRVCFLNEIPRGDKLFRCCQRSIVIRSARTPERAIEAAKKRFARLEGIRDWSIHAALIESEPINLAAEAKSASAPPPLLPPGMPRRRLPAGARKERGPNDAARPGGTYAREKLAKRGTAHAAATERRRLPEK